MRLIHVLANWKWTGPAEPAANLASALARRGHEVFFVCGRPVGGLANRVAEEARARGLEVWDGLPLSKHYRPIANLSARRKLKGWFRRLKPDLVHCHTLNDHLVAGAAARGSFPEVPVVRSLYAGRTPRSGIRRRMLYPRLTSLLLCASDRVRRGVIARFGVPEWRTETVEGAVDLSRFDPDRKLPDLSADYGVEKGDFVVGIVARIQRRRRFEVLFDALERLAGRVPNLRLLLVGRGTHMEEVAVRRAKRSALRDRIVFTGYRTGDEYVATLSLMKTKVFLWPGSDGSCRAVREAMAMGVPVIAADVGMLSEIVTPGKDGLLVPHDGAALAGAIHRLALDPALRDRMAREARASAQSRFDLRRQAELVEGLYRRVAPAGCGDMEIRTRPLVEG